MKRKREKNRIWTTKEKEKIVIPVIEFKKTLQQTCREYDISSGLLSRWIEKYKAEGISGLENKRKPGNPIAKYFTTKKFNSKEEVTTAVVSGRNLFLKNNMQEYNNSNIMNKAVGIGYADKNEHGYFDRKTVEIDFCDIFFLQGILGCILFFIPIIIIIGMIIKKFFVKFKKSILDEDIISMITALALCIFVALFAGHTFVAPAVSIYIAIILARLNNDLEKKEKL